MYSVTVSSASFSATGSNIALLNHWATCPDFLYRYNEWICQRSARPQFVGANVDDWQYLRRCPRIRADFIIVFALNIDNERSVKRPCQPTPPGNHPGMTSATSPSQMVAWRIAYKFAKSNTDVVGNWFTQTKVIAAIYRNARGLIGILRTQDGMRRRTTSHIQLRYSFVGQRRHSQAFAALRISALRERRQILRRGKPRESRPQTQAGSSAPSVGDPRS